MFIKLYIKPTSLADYYSGKSILGFPRFMDQNDVEFYVPIKNNIIIQQGASFIVRKKKFFERFTKSKVFIERK